MDAEQDKGVTWCRPFRRVLVANRGEIALRVIRGCREQGLEAVAVCSDADVSAPHVVAADAFVVLGPAPSSESYLRADRILEACAATGADAVHPGYGFLSENADFAQAVIDAGLVWIGPPPEAITSMGSKTEARRRMKAAGVPIVPGTIDPVRDAARLHDVVGEIGLPVMIKAAAGGGGKGMRRVDREEDLADAIAAARSEASKSFGDDAVYVERLVEHARHVEIQVLADAHGTVLHLGERDCSVQRRHQKVIEEAPCPVLSPEGREAMASAAVRAAQAVGYIGAGTVEFLLASDGSFYFLEMNTRLQVEHPITEAVTGIDLVRAQLDVAAGRPLAFEQSDVALRGHAFELRIYAEDAFEGFRPSPGPVVAMEEPSGPFVRVDSGVRAGDVVSVHYDPMIAKLVVWGRDRSEAISRARRALHEYRIVGIPTSIPFFLALLDDEDFLAGRVHTGFLTPDWLAQHLPAPQPSDEVFLAAALVRFFEESGRVPASTASGSNSQPSAWQRATSTTLGGRA